jgi:hypothetical protein
MRKAGEVIGIEQLVKPIFNLLFSSCDLRWHPASEEIEGDFKMKLG